MIEEVLKLNMKCEFNGSYVLQTLNIVEIIDDFVVETSEMCKRYGKVPVNFLSKIVGTNVLNLQCLKLNIRPRREINHQIRACKLCLWSLVSGNYLFPIQEL